MADQYQLKCRVVDETDDAIMVLVQIGDSQRQRRVFLPHSQTSRLVKAGPQVRAGVIYCDTVCITTWLAKKEGFL